MRKLWMAVACAVFMLAVAAPNAGAIGAFATWWNMNDPGDDGYGGGLRHRMPLVPVIGIDLRASYVKFSGNDIGVFPLEATGIVHTSVLYGGIGLGYYIFNGDKFDLKDDFGWYLVAGAEFSPGPVGVFAEFKWTQLKTDIKNSSGQADFDGAGVNVGVIFGR